jgi:hypothetical protein
VLRRLLVGVDEGVCVMSNSVPEALRNAANERVLAHVAGKSAHSDIGEALALAARTLGDVQTFCPNPANYAYLVVSTRHVIFGFATGMRAVALRLSPQFKTRALETGATECADAGPEWVSFDVFRSDWPQVDLAFWARQAYVFARDGAPTLS